MRDYTDLFLRAQEVEIGLAVRTNSIEGLKWQFANFIRKNPQFSDIMVCIPSLPELIYLVKKSVELPE